MLPLQCYHVTLDFFFYAYSFLTYETRMRSDSVHSAAAMQVSLKQHESHVQVHPLATLPAHI